MRTHILYDGKPAEVVATISAVQVNCTAVTVAALELMLKLHRNAFSPTPSEVTLQSGSDQEWRGK